MDLRPDRVELSLQTRDAAGVTVAHTDLARRITAALAGLGRTDPRLGERRPVQRLEIAIDAVEIPAVRLFWKAVLGYTAEPGDEGSTGAIVDEAGQLPAVWFQQMDAPRPQRNRIHLDLTVPHDEAERRVAAGAQRRWRSRRRLPCTRLLGARRRRGQRGLRLHVAGPRLTMASGH